MIIERPVSNLSTLLIKILLGWSAKDFEISQAQNRAFRLQHTKFLVLRLILRLWCSYYLKFQNSRFEILNQNQKFKTYEHALTNLEL